ncbi:MAG: efflux RND transporter periplasmic adaptor subunit [Chitinophagaceae bacterium]
MLLRKIRIYTSAGSLLMIVACGGNKQQQAMAPGAGPVPVTTASVSTTKAVYYDEYPATVVALNQVDLRAQVSGILTGIYVADGAKVKKGQRLYTVDPQQYEASYQQAQANLAVQEANLVKAQKDADRYRTLDKQDAIAKQQVDNADAALEAAQKQVDAAKANIRAVQTNVKYTNVYAPFDGTIGISQVKVGSPIVAGTTLLNTVSSDNPIAADFSINQNEIYRFAQLEQKGTKGADSTFTLEFGNDIYPYPGRLALLDRAVDPQTGMLKARLSFPNGKGMLRAGMTGKVRVLNNSGTESVLIPYKAVTEQLGEFFVYVVGDSSKVNQRKVVLSKQIGTNVIIKDGLKEGETIVVQGVQNLREGAAIKQDTAAQKKQ